MPFVGFCKKKKSNEKLIWLGGGFTERTDFQSLPQLLMGQKINMKSGSVGDTCSAF